MWDLQKKSDETLTAVAKEGGDPPQRAGDTQPEVGTLVKTSESTESTSAVDSGDSNEPALVPDIAPGGIVQEVLAMKLDNPCKTLFCLASYNSCKFRGIQIYEGGIVQEVLRLDMLQPLQNPVLFCFGQVLETL